MSAPRDMKFSVSYLKTNGCLVPANSIAISRAADVDMQPYSVPPCSIKAVDNAMPARPRQNTDGTNASACSAPRRGFATRGEGVQLYHLDFALHPLL